MLRIALVLLIGFGLAGFGVVAWVALPGRDTAAAATATPAKLAVLTAARPIRPGALLKPEDIVSHEIETSTLPQGYVLDQDDSSRTLIGGMVRRSLAAGDVLRLPLDVLRPADHGFLAAVLSPGTRAVTIAVDAVSGTAGLIWPGDRVDLILTQASAELTQAPGRRVSAETVLRDVRVIAIDQQIVKSDSAAGPDQKLARTITLEVSPSSAETVQVATRLGQLSLTVRSADLGPDNSVRPGVTYAGDVSSALPAPAAQAAVTSIRLFQGSRDGKEFKF